MLFRSNDTATTEIYTLSLHDALPISNRGNFTINVVSLSEVLALILSAMIFADIMFFIIYF